MRQREQKKFNDFKELKKAGVIVKRAQAFIEAGGQRQAGLKAFC